MKDDAGTFKGFRAAAGAGIQRNGSDERQEDRTSRWKDHEPAMQILDEQLHTGPSDLGQPGLRVVDKAERQTNARKMNIGIIGAGNLGTGLAKQSVKKGHVVTQLVCFGFTARVSAADGIAKSQRLCVVANSVCNQKVGG